MTPDLQLLMWSYIMTLEFVSILYKVQKQHSMPLNLKLMVDAIKNNELLGKQSLPLPSTYV